MLYQAAYLQYKVFQKGDEAKPNKIYSMVKQLIYQ
jgi:hypothetical protein